MYNIVIQIFILFGIMAIGLIANKFKIMSEQSDRQFSKLIVNITIPATIIASSISQVNEDKNKVFLLFAAAIAFFMICPVLSFILSKLFKMNNIYELMLNYSNLGFMGIPIVSAVYGEKSVFFVSIFMMIFNVSLFSYGISVIQRSNPSKQKISLSTWINPGIISALIAIIIYFASIPVPAPIVELLNHIGSITTPLAMLVLGSTIAQIKFGDVLKEKKLYQFALLKLILIPLALWLILKMFIHDPVILGIAVILSALPTAGNVSMLCLEYNVEIELVAKGIFISTIGSLITIPILLFFIG